MPGAVIIRGGRRRQETPGGARRRQEAPGGARRRQEAPGGAKQEASEAKRKQQGGKREAKRKGGFLAPTLYIYIYLTPDQPPHGGIILYNI